MADVMRLFPESQLVGSGRKPKRGLTPSKTLV